MTESNVNYSNVYKEYQQQINALDEYITEKETGKDNFIVYNLEAGTGKSRETARILDEYLAFPFRKFLVVKKFSNEVEELVTQLKDHKRYVLGITADNWQMVKQDIENLHKYAVVVITHERYNLLAKKQANLRPYFEEGRHTLIHDERPDLPSYKIDKEDKAELHRLLGLSELQFEVHKVFKKIDQQIEYHDTLKKGVIYPIRRLSIHPKTLEKFIDKIEAHRGEFTENQYNQIMDILENVKGVFEADHCFYNKKKKNGVIAAHNNSNTVWGLQNNIILDATGGIDHIYKLHKKYQVTNQTRFVDHSKSSLNFYKFKSSKGKIVEHSDAYYREVIEHISNTKDPKLIVIQKSLAQGFYNYLLMAGYKEDEILIHNEIDESIEGKKIIINWYGNLTGRNQYKDIENIWLLGTPHKQFSDYVIDFVMYAERSLGRRSKEFHGGKFYNEDLLNIQNTYLAKDMYQALKRVARHTIPRAQYNIVMDDDDIKKILSRMFKNISVRDFNFDFVEELKAVTESKVTKAKRQSNGHKIYKHLTNLKNGEYQKKDICQALGIESKNLSRYITERNKLIGGLLKTGEIKKTKYTIIVDMRGK